MMLPHTLKRIRLNLARSKEFPSGSPTHGYELVAPLDESGHIDPQLWHRYRDHCRVRRFWQGEHDQIGHLVHKSGEDDETGYRFGAHTFAQGEYVSLRDDVGELQTFQVTSVEPAS